ncbi:MAG: SDR family oxidoreductase [Planktomarina sp.]
MSHLTGKRIIITGASKGIGAATATYMAMEGAKITLAARTEDAIVELAEQINLDGGSAIAVACDVADYAQVQTVIDATVDAFGGVDVLVNNAGLIDPIGRLTDLSADDFGRVIDVNLKGVFNGMKAAIPAMDGDGTIINISSGAAYGVLEGWCHYSASKAGVLQLTRAGDKEYGDMGIRSIGLSPGTVATDMQREIKASGINAVAAMDFDQHIPADYVAKTIGYLIGPGGDAHLGADFSIKTNEGRAAVGLPPVST